MISPIDAAMFEKQVNLSNVNRVNQQTAKSAETNPFVRKKQAEEQELINKLNAIDSRTISPECRSEANGKKLYLYA